MTATLKLTVAGEAQARGARVLAHLHALEGGLDTSLIATVGEEAMTEVRDGRYLIEVMLPSGQRLREVADLFGPAAGSRGADPGTYNFMTAGSDPTAEYEVRLASSGSPHEWLGFHHLFVTRSRLAGLTTGLAKAALPGRHRVYTLGGHGLASAALSSRADLPAMHHDAFVWRYRLGPNQTAMVELNDRELRFHAPWATEFVITPHADSLSVLPADPKLASALSYLAAGQRERATQVMSGGDWRGFGCDQLVFLGDEELRRGSADQAASWFLHALKEGPPVLTHALELLREGLWMLSDRSAEVQRAAETVREWSTRTDPREPITVMRVP